MKKLILLSSSPWRAKVLADAGIAFETLVPGIDEKAIRHADPVTLTLAIARAKMAAAASMVTGPAYVITADQVVVFHGQIREKPTGVPQAAEWLMEYRGNVVQSVTSLCVARLGFDAADGGDLEVRGTDTVDIRLAAFPLDIVTALAQDDACLHSAGAFVYEHPFIAGFVTMEAHRTAGGLGRDDREDRVEHRHAMETSVSGLPLQLLYDLLSQVGWQR